MGVRLYDEAFYAKIKSWVEDDNIRILKPNEVTRTFQQRADLSGDNLTLPLISLSRNSNIEVTTAIKDVKSYDGKKIYLDDKKTYQLNAIPIKITYQIDIYTKEYSESDIYLSDFIFNIINYPKLCVSVPYKVGNRTEHIDMEANIRLMNTIADNSDVSEKLFPDQFTRWTLEIEVTDAYLFNVESSKNWSVKDAELNVITNGEINDIDTESLTFVNAKLNDEE